MAEDPSARAKNESIRDDKSKIEIEAEDLQLDLSLKNRARGRAMLSPNRKGSLEETVFKSPLQLPSLK